MNLIYFSDKWELWYKKEVVLLKRKIHVLEQNSNLTYYCFGEYYDLFLWKNKTFYHNDFVSYDS